MAVVTARVAKNAGEEPEAGSSPGSDCDAECDNGRKEVDDDKHGGAVARRRVVRVDHVQLQVERGSEEGFDLLGEGRARGAEA